jgi:hypothetical protein
MPGLLIVYAMIIQGAAKVMIFPGILKPFLIRPAFGVEVTVFVPSPHHDGKDSYS